MQMRALIFHHLTIHLFPFGIGQAGGYIMCKSQHKLYRVKNDMRL